MELTESTNTWHCSDRFIRTNKVNNKKKKKKKWGIMVSWKSLFSKWTAVREEKTYYLKNLVFSEKKMDSYFSVPTLGNPWTYVKQGWCYSLATHHDLIHEPFDI